MFNNQPIIGLMSSGSLSEHFKEMSVPYPLFMIKGNVEGNDELYYDTNDVRRFYGEKAFRQLECDVVTVLLPVRHVEQVCAAAFLS